MSGKWVTANKKRLIVNDYTDPKSLCYEDINRLAEKYRLHYNTIYNILVDAGVKRTRKYTKKNPEKSPTKEIETMQISPETTIIKIPFPLKRVVIRLGETDIVLEG